jgi:protein-tyrosine phosphatase
MRHLPLPGTYNVRDVGGYVTADGRSVRWRTLFRSDNLHRLTPDGQAELLRHGLRTIVDLRGDPEAGASPNVLATSTDVRYVRIRLMAGLIPVEEARTLDDLYLAIIAECQESIREVLATLAAPDIFPVLIHCTAGKDRTGIVVALLLGLLGIEHAHIAEDYALTASYITDEFLEGTRQQLEAAGHDWSKSRHQLDCPAETMLMLLGHLDEQYGGVEGYLQHIGLTADEIGALRTALFDDGTGPQP